jgi:glutathione S-transferase
MSMPHSPARLQLYDLAGAAPECRFSPYCWRAKFALAHKRLPFDAIPWRFTDKHVIAFSDQGRVPVLVDGDRVVFDAWTDTVVNSAIAPMIVADILAVLHEKDCAYFRESREKRFGAALEAVVADRDTRVTRFRQSLAPLRAVLATQPYLGGEIPLYVDYIVFGSFQWARCASPFRLLLPDDPISTWRGRLLGLFNGLAQNAPGYPL